MRRHETTPLSRLGPAALAVLLAVAARPAAGQERETEATRGVDAASRTVVVEMVDFAFRPARVAVRPGDTVRFLQTSASPHNVEFRDVPAGTRLGDDYQPSVARTGTRAIDFPPPKMGPFVLAEGDTYEIVIGDYFAAGEHEFVCTPHEAMGMKGLLVVEGSPDVIPAGEDE